MSRMTKQVSGGRTAVIEGRANGLSVYARATLDGREIGSGWPGKIPPIDGHPEMTHGLGTLALTTTEYEQVLQVIDDTRAEVLATPEGARLSLRGKRRALVTEHADLIHAADAAKAAAFDRGQLAEHLTGPHADTEAEILVARDALDRFDTEHPEIRAEVHAETATRVNDHLWD